MCGIAGIYFKDTTTPYLTAKEIENTVDWLHCGIEHRGTHATGIAVQDNEGNQTVEKSDMPASKFIFWRQDIIENPKAILLHTRLATKGKPENLLNNHPVQYKNVMAVHNGHISNDDELFAEEELERIAEVDSEIIPALLHKYTFEDPKMALEKMSGGFAIAAFDSENPGTLLLAKGSSSPLIYLETSGMWIWASTEETILAALENGFGFEAKKDDLSELKYGEYIMINGHESDKQDFKPYYKTYTPAKSWSNENRSYTDGWHNGGSSGAYNGYGRNQCDECFVWFPEHQLNKIGREFYCDHCEKKLYVIGSDGTRTKRDEPKKKLSRKERKRIRKAKARRFQEEQSGQKTIVIPKAPESIGDALEAEHWAVCQLVAEFYGTKPDFVNYLVFEETEENIEAYDDENLTLMHTQFHDKYQEVLEEVRLETDKLIDAMVDEVIVCNAGDDDGKFPVGF